MLQLLRAAWGHEGRFGATGPFLLRGVFLRGAARPPASKTYGSGDGVGEDAVLMERQAERALSDANSTLVSYGYYTPVIVLMGEGTVRISV
jgi:hypothetical protein